MDRSTFHIIDHLCRPGNPHHPCEDLLRLDESYLLLMDGASPLAPSIMTPSDASWFVWQVDRLLASSLTRHASLSSILADGMASIRPLWRGSTSVMPSAGIAVVRLNQDRLDYLQLGDVTLSIERTDGTFMLIKDEALCRLDAMALAELQAHAARSGNSPRECLPLIQETLKRNRALRNTPEGYSILDPSGKGLTHAITGSLPVADVQSILLFSDGFGQLQEFTKESLPDLYKRVKEQGLSPLLDELYQFQDQDTSFHRVARFKHRDDASATIASVALTPTKTP